MGDAHRSYRLRRIGGELAICRVGDAAVPAWVLGLLDDGLALVGVVRTRAGLSVVCPAERVPRDVTASPGWRALEVVGPLDFDLVGVLASLAGALAEAGVPIFAISTWETDSLLVREADAGRAERALRAAGHEVLGSD